MAKRIALRVIVLQRRMTITTIGGRRSETISGRSQSVSFRTIA